MQSAVWVILHAGNNGSQNNIAIKTSEMLNNLSKLTQLTSVMDLISWVLNRDLTDS